MTKGGHKSKSKGAYRDSRSRSKSVKNYKNKKSMRNSSGKSRSRHSEQRSVKERTRSRSVKVNRRDQIRDKAMSKVYSTAYQIDRSGGEPTRQKHYSRENSNVSIQMISNPFYRKEYPENSPKNTKTNGNFKMT